MAKIDVNRNLCETCGKNQICTFDCYEELGDNANVIKCKKFKKYKAKKPRANKGEQFFFFSMVDDNDKSKGFKVNKRIDNELRIDTLLYDLGNYFLTSDKCLTAISKL